MVSHGLHQQIDLMARGVEFFPASDGGNRAVRQTAHLEAAKHPAVGVVKIKDLAEPVDQQVRRVRALSLNRHGGGGVDALQIDDDVHKSASGVGEGFFARRPEGLEPYVRGMSSN